MMGVGHGLFRETLIRMGKNAGIRVVPFSEAWTSKLCGVCGVANMALGGSKVFKCQSRLCGAREMRDAGAARKILILYCYTCVPSYLP